MVIKSLNSYLKPGKNRINVFLLLTMFICRKTLSRSRLKVIERTPIVTDRQTNNILKQNQCHPTYCGNSTYDKNIHLNCPCNVIQHRIPFRSLDRLQTKY